jgi:putative chitinase
MGRFVSQAAEPVARAVRQLTRQQAQEMAANARTEATRRNREGAEETSGSSQRCDARGCFGAGDGDGDKGKDTDGTFVRLKAALSGHGDETLGDVDKFDPAIEAANEMKSLVTGAVSGLKTVGELGRAVIGRGFGRGFGGGPKDCAIPWYKRMLQQLKLMRLDDGEFHRAELRALNDQHRTRDGGSGGGGIGGMMESMASKFLPGGVLAAVKAAGALAAKVALPVAGIVSAVKSFNTSTDDYAKKMGVDDTGGLGKNLAIRAAGALGDLGDTVTFGLATKVGKAISPTVNAAVDSAKKAADIVGEHVVDPVREASAVAVDKVKSVFGKGSAGNKAALVQGMQNAGISDPKEQAMFMAQMDHESEGFRSLEENIKYRPKNFLKMFGKRAGIKTEEEARAILCKGEGATAEAMYGGEWGKKNLGNTTTGDALAFKGRGFAQLTGRANYTAAAKATGLDLVSNPELAADPANAAKIATWYWQSRKGLSEAGKAGNVTAATKTINGGDNGLADRKNLFDKYLAETTAAAPVAGRSGAQRAARGEASTQAAPVPALPMVTLPTLAMMPLPLPLPLQAPLAGSMSLPAIAVNTPTVPPPVPRADAPVPLSSKGPLEVTVRNGTLANTDIRGRRLAHIATSGISGG